MSNSNGTEEMDTTEEKPAPKSNESSQEMGTSSRKRLDSIVNKVPKKTKRRELCLDVGLLSELSTGFEDKDDSSPNEARAHVLQNPEFGNLKEEEVKLSRPRSLTRAEKSRLEEANMIDSKRSVDKPTHYTVKGLTGGEPFNEDFIVKHSGKEWVQQILQNKLVYPNYSKRLVLLINNIKFEKKSERYGSEKDAARVKRLFGQLGCILLEQENLKASDMKECIRRFSQNCEHESADSAFVILMSHGNNEIIWGTDEAVELNELIALMNPDNAPMLVGKPKFFIIEACRGDNPDPGYRCYKKDDPNSTSAIAVPISQNVQTNENLKLNGLTLDNVVLSSGVMKHERFISYTVPTDADILVAYACAESRGAFIHKEKGSWFIRSICEIFSEHVHKEHILDLFTMVNNRVSRHEDYFWSKQISQVLHTLTLKFYFLPVLNQDEGISNNNENTAI